MRLTKYEIESIKKSFLDVFGEGKIYLFGSRVDDEKKGGDIDLYLCPSKKFEDERKKRINFIIKLEEYIGEQKIDIILRKDKNRTIEKVAIRDGIEL